MLEGNMGLRRQENAVFHSDEVPDNTGLPHHVQLTLAVDTGVASTVISRTLLSHFDDEYDMGL